MSLAIHTVSRWVNAGMGKRPAEGKPVILSGVLLSGYALFGMLQAAAPMQPVQINLVVNVAVLVAGVTLIVNSARAFEKIQNRLDASAERDKAQEDVLGKLVASHQERNEHIIRIETTLSSILKTQDKQSETLLRMDGQATERDARVGRNEAKIEAVGIMVAELRHDVETAMQKQNVEIERLRDWRHELANEANVLTLQQELQRRKAASAARMATEGEQE